MRELVAALNPPPSHTGQQLVFLNTENTAVTLCPVWWDLYIKTNIIETDKY